MVAHGGGMIILESVSEKRKLWKKWKRENNKDKYLETRKMLGRLCIRSNVKQKKNICNEKVLRNDQKYDNFMTLKGMFKTNYQSYLS